MQKFVGNSSNGYPWIIGPIDRSKRIVGPSWRHGYDRLSGRKKLVGLSGFIEPDKFIGPKGVGLIGPNRLSGSKVKSLDRRGKLEQTHTFYPNGSL